MTEAEAAQDQLRAVADELATIRVVLKGIRSSLPEPPREEDLDDEEEPHDWSAALRSVIDCVLTDSIEPAIRDLQAATSFCGPGREG
jgi:hypothetical protein